MTIGERQKLTAPELRGRKGSRLVMVTAYDHPTARMAEAAGVDLILVGDSMGTAILGYETTVPVTLDDILHHAKAVVRGAPRTFIVADLPFMTYQVSDVQAVENAGRLMKETGADAVKLEGGRAMVSRIQAIANAGIPLLGHVGLTPQTAGALGGFKVQGRDLDQARAILADAEAVAAAGVCCLVVEAVPTVLAELITERVPVPTIGIGAGPACDGQVLVVSDLLALYPDTPMPKFAKPFGQVGLAIRDAFAQYAADVRAGTYPDPDHSYHMRRDTAAALRGDEGNQ